MRTKTYPYMILIRYHNTKDFMFYHFLADHRLNERSPKEQKYLEKVFKKLEIKFLDPNIKKISIKLINRRVPLIKQDEDEEI